MINGEADEVIKSLFDSLKNRYQKNLESMKGSENYVHLLYYKCRKVSPNRVGLHIDSPDWIKKQKSSNKSHQKKCFQHALTAMLNHAEIKKDPQIITKIKPFINKYNWE